jgi:hypothetical protein
MKVLLFDTTQAYLTPGGKTVHAIKLQQEISKLGVSIEFARWWDESLNDFDIIHLLSSSNTTTIKNSSALGKKVLFTMIMDHATSKSKLDHIAHRIFNRFIEILPTNIKQRISWTHLHHIDKFVFMHQYDKECALSYYPKQISKHKTIVIPHAFDPSDLIVKETIQLNVDLPAKYLISCGHVSQRKQSVLLAQYAKQAKVPIVFIGSGNPNDLYFRNFLDEVDNKFVYYLGYVSNEVKNYVESKASGFVLLSTGESGCIAVYEAAAFKLPLLLSNLPWAWGYEKAENIFFCDQNNSKLALQQIIDFYKKSSRLEHPPFKIHTWREIAQMYKACYSDLLSNIK